MRAVLVEVAVCVNIFNTFDRPIGRSMMGLHHLARADADPRAITRIVFAC